MNFNEFVIQFDAPKARIEVIDLERRWCACHCRPIWVPKTEEWPYFCKDNPKLLSAGAENANL